MNRIFVSFETLGQIVSLASMFIAVPIYIKVLGLVDYGAWLTFVYLVGLASYFEVDVNTRLIKIKISGELNSEVFSALLAVRVMNFFIIWSIYAIILNISVEYFDLGGVSHQELNRITILFTISYFLSFMNSSMAALVLSMGKSVIYSTCGNIQQTLTIITPLVFMKCGFGVTSFVMSMLIVNFIFFLFFIALICKGLKNSQLTLDRIGVPLYRDIKWIVKSSLVQQMWNVGNQARTTSFHLSINLFAGAELVAIASLLSKVPQTISISYAKLVYPLYLNFLNFTNNGQTAKSYRVFFKSTFYSVRISLLSLLGVYIFNIEFVRLWTGIEVGGHDQFLFAMCIMYFIPMAFSVTGVFLTAHDFIGKFTFLNFVEIFSSVALAFLFYRLYGNIGIVVAFILCESIFFTRLLLFLIVKSRAFLKTMEGNNMLVYAIPILLPFITLFELPLDVSVFEYYFIKFVLLVFFGCVVTEGLSYVIYRFTGVKLFYWRLLTGLSNDLK